MPVDKILFKLYIILVKYHSIYFEYIVYIQNVRLVFDGWIDDT